MMPAKRMGLCVVLCVVMLAAGSKAQALDNSATQATKSYADSRIGIEEQFADILQVVRTNDEASIHRALDTLSIPDANGWITAQFTTDHIAQEQQAYQQSLDKFQSHVWWVTGNLGKNPQFALKVEESSNSKPLSDVGFEGLLPRPKDAVKIETYRFISTVNDPKLGKPSWVSSFIYVDGRFRMIGGTFPFWAEGLNASRGPMSLPPEVIRGRIVQAAAFRNDASGSGIDAIVHIQIEVGHNGKVKNMKVLSGDPEFVSDAQQYLKEAEFPQLPDDPRLAHMKTIWDMEVAFFTSKSSTSVHP